VSANRINNGIFNNNEFGFHRITIERPLKLNFQASPERIERLAEERTWQGLVTNKKKGAAAGGEIAEGKATQQAVLRVLQALADPIGWAKRSVPIADAAKARGVKLAAPAEIEALEAEIQGMLGRVFS
jgi:type I restriction enzyme M protein